MAFGNLTVDFRQLSRIPVRDRVTLAQSPQASSIFGNLSPTEIAALFPDYYKKFIPSGGGGGASMSAGMTGADYTSGDSTPTPTTGGATPAPTGPTRPALIQDILSSAGPMPGQGGKKSGTEGLKGRQQMMKMVYDGYISAGFSHKQALAFTAEVGRENGYNASLIFGTHTDLNGHTNAGMISMQKDRRVNLFNYLQTQGLIDENGKMIQSQETINAQARFQMMEIREKYPKTAKKFLENPDISMEDAAVILGDDYIRWARKGNPRIGFSAADAARHAAGRDRYYYEIQKITENFPTEEQQGLPGTAPIDQTAPADETGIIPLERGGTATVAPQTQTFDPAIFTQLDPRIQEYYNTATEDEKKQLEYALMKTGVAKVNEIAQKHPRATAETVTTTVVQDAQQSAMNVSEAINQDPLEFWKARNPQGARIDDLDQETLRTAMMAAIKLEADMAAKGAPKKVEIYGPSSGVRTDPSKAGSRHGVNFKEALDVAIYDVDPNTGQKLTNKSGPYGNYPNIPGHGGIDPEGFALYHEFGQNAELARMFLANRGDEKYQGWGIRQGQLFSDTQFDFMHIDRTGGVNPDTGVSIHVAPHGVGSVAGGMTESGVRKLGIDPNSDAGRRLMTGVTERFGKTRQDIALSAEAAYGPRPGVETTPTQSLPGTEPQTQIPNINPETGSDVNTINLEQPQQANTNMALGGTRSTDVEPNMVNEKYTIAQTDPKTGETKPVANFNKEEEVNIKDGQMNVESAYKKQAQQTLQQTDTGAPQANQYKMRQTTERPNDALGEQIKYGIVPRSPSYERSMYNTRFGDGHFTRGSKNNYT